MCPGRNCIYARARSLQSSTGGVSLSSRPWVTNRGGGAGGGVRTYDTSAVRAMTIDQNYYRIHTEDDNILSKHKSVYNYSTYVLQCLPTSTHIFISIFKSGMS